MKNIIIVALVALALASCSRPEWFQTRSEHRQVIRESRSWSKAWKQNGERMIKTYPSISH